MVLAFVGRMKCSKIKLPAEVKSLGV